MDKVLQTLYGVLIAVGFSTVLFVGVNLFFDLAPRRWKWFTSLVGGVIGFVPFLILWGNGLFGDIGPAMPFIGAGIGAGVGFLFSQTEADTLRLAYGLAGGGTLGLLSGLFLEDTLLPSLEVLDIVIWVAVGLALGWVYWQLRGKRKSMTGPLVMWGTLGWIAGAWLTPTLDGSRGEAIVAAVVTGLGFGAMFGLLGSLGQRQRVQMVNKARVYIFLVPALGFIAMTLLLPLLRTIYLSFLGTEGAALFGQLKWVGLRQYGDIFTDDGIIDFSDWTSIFGSRMFWAGVILIAIGSVIGVVLGRRTGHRVAASAGSVGPWALGTFFLAFALFASIRGTISNNLWWVFTVTVLATTLGLAIAVLADRANYESLAKSLIFMPMAISFVGAGIIWRFMYIARPETDDQTGFMNAVWVGLGDVSNSGTGTAVAVAILGLLTAGLLYLAWRGYQAGTGGLMLGSIATSLPLLWLIYRFLGPGLGGFARNNAGDLIADTVLFQQESPFNNVWLMVVLIWIQTGFAMVIFSAAIKAVPAELIEASKVDGATESETFWRVTIPQIATTIGVVVTTTIVLVLKVFDIVKVMTNGNFDTQVLANEMWQRAFTEGNFGLGSALAVLLFVAVLPIMFLNIRRMQEAGAQ